MHRTIVRVLVAFWTVVGVVACAGAIALAMGGCTVAGPIGEGPQPGAPMPSVSRDAVLPVFRTSLKIQADGQEHFGIVTLRRISMGRKIKFEIPKGTYQFSITTCAGEMIVDRPEAGWFEWRFVPVYGLENLGSCIAIATALTDKGEIHKGIIDFNDGQDMPAVVWCNRDRMELSGAALCQSRAEYGRPGLVQRVDFDLPTVWAATPGCSEPQQSGFVSTDWEIAISPGFCVYKFEDARRRKFRLTTYGYTDIKHILPAGG